MDIQVYIRKCLTYIHQVNLCDIVFPQYLGVILMLGYCPFYMGKKPCRTVTDNTALQTQDSKFKPWRSEAEHATSRSQRQVSQVDGEETSLFLLKRRDRETSPEL